ncbi:MAG: ACT domain-containing protein [Erysipelotrichaceae bacterium]|nr:ACT domain-containing protein [Erysipelotrichaceae bacterium]
MVGILPKLFGILAENQIGIFTVSTYNADYILVKEENFERALEMLAFKGYKIV